MKRRFDILLPLADDALQGESCWRDDWNVPGQSAFMLLAKFQQLNALSCTALAEIFLRKPGPWALRRDIDLRDARQFDLLRMTYLLRMSLPDVAAAFLARWDLSEVESDPTLRWCPQCAARGVHLTAFQFAGCDTCPVHGCKLRDRCAQCGRTMVGYRLRASIFRSPFSCPACGHDWAPALRSIDDRALRLSPAYRYSVAQSLARSWFGRRPPNVGRLLRPFDQTGDRGAWLASAPRRGSNIDAADAFCHSIVRGHTDADQYASSRHRDLSCAVHGPEDELRTDAAARIRASRIKNGDEILTDAVACYKAIKRYIMRCIGSRHQACVVTAACHLAWRLDARTTTPYCPAAQALLRWRSKWEGVGVPSHLLVKSDHGLLGILVWLSLYAPVGLPQWSRATDRWVILHIFAQACLDSFAYYLSEVADAKSMSGPVWMQFPVVDFPEREWVVVGGDPEQNRIRLVIAPTPVRRITKLQIGDEHYQQHSSILNENAVPTERPMVPARRKRGTNFNCALKSIDPLFVDRKGSVGVTAMVLAVFFASDAE
ncbi:hypothetical protein PQR37_25765 [Paraburkholderia nemoris]|uniref:hypothetical protein n=1 Tax=Paraburkholderia nemoris TaxID=2793076 RepID=UPI0038BC4E07